MTPAVAAPPRRTRRGSGRATLADVARVAGVSAQTVSRVLNSPATVPEATVNHVRAAIQQVGYVPNRLAGGLASGRSRLVAALVPAIASPVFLETLEALTQTLAAHGYQLMLGESGYDDADEIELLENLISRGPDGIVLTRVLESEAARQRLARSGIPVVESWDLTATPVDMLIGFSHEAVGARVAQAMHERGVRCPALITGNDPRAQRRRQGYAEELARLGLLVSAGADAMARLPTAVVNAPAPMGSGRRALADLLQRHPDIDGVFCSTDMLALGALIEAREHGIAVPDQLAVVGFGDHVLAADTSPALTTIRIDGRRIGTQAAEWIVQRAAGHAVSARVQDIGFELIVRASA
ncbi:MULTISPECIES: LacI family DNA-binding transcriptional regulator [unclassified Achromobacter]|uniref:LacI family DNA-binding transcriptional regulator n=1 Tax=unclassified Achromobacter TaxID=2626865 RepID=UPI000B514BB9|nr:MULTISPECIES: LacI family DNA-binding transcriptional regulator [unclassified Achromobacter]OWT71498.1 GntR family transcriptional regulator [Achromobacter sp. HZ34]OWT73155.1 GntR family transcriptional regulator [Achromobacter sp. HZ28]